jgi:predicted metal-dependent phosphoesterase TrpH
MHSHTCYSGDAVTTLDELAERIESAGLDVICITDHHAVRGALAAIERGVGCRVVVGEEVKTRAGEVIGLFLSERVPHGLPPEETIARIRAQGGVVYVPHPFDPVRHALREPVLRRLCADGSIDALEVLNAKVSLDHLNARAGALAAETGLPGGAGSDAHDPAALGAAYVEMADFDGPTDFLAKLPAGRIVGHRFDRARGWTPRIIPSGLTQT